MRRISINILLVLILLLQSCLKEDRSMCKSWLLLRFRYTLNDQYTNLFGQEVHKVTVYVFDEHGKYVDRFSEQGSALTNDYVMRLPLPEGIYSIIAYGGDFTTYTAGELNPNNTLNNTLRPGITDISDFRIELKNTNGLENYLYPAATPDDLYAGFAAGAIAELNSGHITDVDLIKDTKQIIVRIINAPSARMTTDAVISPFDVYITALNGRYLFDNNIDLNHTIYKYTPVSTEIQSNYIESNLKIMRLMLGQLPMLVIRNNSTQEIIYNKNMVEQISQNPQYVTQEDFDRENQFIFEITLPSENQGSEIGVSINGWKINNVFPDIE